MKWFRYAIADYLAYSSNYSAILAAANNRPLLQSLLDNTDAWYQVAMYGYLVNIKLWDFIFIDINAPTPPPPPTATRGIYTLTVTDQSFGPAPGPG